MGLVADIYVDGSYNQPFQNGFDCEVIIGENACGVGVRIYNMEVGMEADISVACDYALVDFDAEEVVVV